MSRPPSKSSENNFDEAKNFFLLGLESYQKELYEEAERFLLLSLEFLPDRLSTLTNLFAVLIKLEKLEKANEIISKTISLYPTNETVYLNQGQLFEKNKNWQMALSSYGKAIDLKPGCAEAYFNCAVALKELKRFDEALASYDRAIELEASYSVAYSNRGVVLSELKRFDEALASYNKAIELKSDYAEAYSNRGNVLNELKLFDEALASYDKAIQLKGDYAEAYSNRGNVLNELKLFDEALASYDKAIELKSDYAEAYSNRGVVLNELKRFDESSASYDRAIELKSDYAEAYLNKSLLLLSLQDFENGWPLYEWRWKGVQKKAYRNFPQPLWLGVEPLINKTILLHAEQGLGDTIQFCRYAALIKKSGAKVLLEVPTSLIRLLKDLEGVDVLLEKGKKLPDFDYQCPLLSLPLAFKTELNSISSPTPYLQSNAEKIMVWNQRLGTKSRLRIGLVWSGSTTHKNDHNRSLALADLINYLPQNIEYVSLQKEVRECDKNVLVNSAIKNYSQWLIDFTDTAALCDLMDIVISVDTSVAHLAAALGKPTWIVLPYKPDWRWLLDRDDSPWYESVFLYRQGDDRKWGSVLERVAGDLTKISK
ncbi:MAG: tetratricopeptide repeat protein [Gammaproteobacteria bacterium]|nr:tetratricopeptide repeat protein [Gammaproteobacteria bacterium]